VCGLRAPQRRSTQQRNEHFNFVAPFSLWNAQLFVYDRPRVDFAWRLIL